MGAIERGRPLVDARLPPGGVPEPGGVRSARRRAGGRPDRCLGLRGPQAGRAARRRALVDRPAAVRGRGRGLSAGRAGRRHRARRPALPAQPPEARGSGAPRLRRRRRPDHRLRRVLSRPAPGPTPAGGAPRGRADGARRRGLDARGDRPVGGRALQRGHAEVVGATPAGAHLPGAPRGRRLVHRRFAVHARPGPCRRADANRRTRVRRPGRRPASPCGADPRMPRRRRHVRLLPPQGHRRGRSHEGSGGQAADDRAAGRRARGAADGSGRRLRHRRPRDADLSRRDPFGRPGPACPRRAGCAHGRRHLLRRARLLAWDSRPPARPRPDASPPERSRPPALPRLPADAVCRRRRLSRAAGAAEAVRAVEGRIPFRGFETWYRDVGPEVGVALLCLHGGPGSTHFYFEPLEQLAEEGRRVVVYDQLGCGNSDRPDDPELWTVELFRSEVQALRDALSLGRIHLLGTSWGAMLSIEYMLTRPSGIVSLTLNSPPTASETWTAEARRARDELPTTDPEYVAASDEFWRRHIFRLEPAPDFVERGRAAKNEEIYKTLWGESEWNANGRLHDWDVRDRLSEIRVPTLVTSGRYDECTPKLAADAAQGIP